MKKDNIIKLIIVLFLIMLALSIYLFMNSRLGQLEDERFVEKEIGEEIILISPGDSIKKYVLERGGLRYKIIGSFSEPPRYDGSLLEGKFIIKGDALNREIRTFIGTVKKTALLGSYEDSSLGGNSTWERVETRDLVGLFEPGDEVIIEFLLPLSQEGEGKSFILKNERIMDSLTKEFKTGQFNLSIPDSLIFVSEKIGTYNP